MNHVSSHDSEARNSDMPTMGFIFAESGIRKQMDAPVPSQACRLLAAVGASVHSQRRSATLVYRSQFSLSLSSTTYLTGLSEDSGLAALTHQAPATPVADDHLAFCCRRRFRRDARAVNAGQVAGLGAESHRGRARHERRTSWRPGGLQRRSHRRQGHTRS
jgi:hypothetical protein